MPSHRSPVSALMVLVTLLAAASTLAAASESAAAPPGAEVSCPAEARAAEACAVDAGTFVGWRSFALNCQACHGGSGLGSTFAPNLLDRLNQRVDYARFLQVVENGYTGQVGVMPAWRAKSDVMANRDNLYRYLRARADGRLPPGRPQKGPRPAPPPTP